MNHDFNRLTNLIIICDLYVKWEKKMICKAVNIATDTDLPPSTVRENLHNFESKKLVAKDSKGQFRLTAKGESAVKEASFLWKNINNNGNGETALINYSFDLGCKFFKCNRYLVFVTVFCKQVYGAREVIDSIQRFSCNYLVSLEESSVNRTIRDLRNMGFLNGHNAPTPDGIHRLDMVNSFINQTIGNIEPPQFSINIRK